MPEQVRTFWPVYLAKKGVGSAQTKEVYFNRDKGIKMSGPMPDRVKRGSEIT